MRSPRRNTLVCLLVWALGLPAAAARGAMEQGPPVVQAVGEVTLTASDAERTATFFTETFGARRLGEEETSGTQAERLWGVFGARVRTVHLQLGQERFAVMQFLTPRGRTIPREQRSCDGGFQHLAIVVRDMDEAYRRLRARGVAQVSPEPQTLPAWNHAAGGIRAFYFRDPDDHTLELIWFPAGKGDPRWQRRPAPLFMGIDHTAIGVSDTSKSLSVYRDLLGLRVAGESENYGPEQERLNNVFGAHLRITALRASAGPGIELIEYLSPRDGRPAPPDLHANDLLHWHTALVVADLAWINAATTSGRLSLVSAPVDGAPTKQLVRDADAHGLLFVTERSR